MKDRKITANMIAAMSKQSLKASRTRNLFVMLTIVLASALLTAISMFAVGQKQQIKNELSHSRQASYYNLTEAQVETLKSDSRIACQIQVKTGVLSELDGFDVIPYYVSELSDQIQVGELESGKLPQQENEIALQASLLEKMKIAPAVGSQVEFCFYDGSTETFLVSGILKGGIEVKQFPIFFSRAYAENGSQLKEKPYEVYARLTGAEQMYSDECKETIFQIGSDAGIERKYISPSKAFLDSLSVDSKSVIIYGLAGAVILLAAILVIYGVFYLSVMGRIHQFGQLRTIGMTRKQMKRFVSHEGRRLFFRAAPIGIMIGVATGYFLIPDGFRILHTLVIIALVFVIVYSITMISVHKPARFAACVSPMEALRYAPQDGMKKAVARNLCRRLTPFGLGVMNFSRNRKKAAITMCSLGLGGILFMTAATYISSFDKENFARQGNFIDAEFELSYAQGAVELDEYGLSALQAKFPLNQLLIQEILSQDGVKKVKEIKGFGVKYDHPAHDEYGNNDMVSPLAETELEGIDSYLEEGSADIEKLMSGDYVLITGNNVAEEIFGWRFAVGDKITLHYYDGSQMSEKQVLVLGILNQQYTQEHNDQEGWFVMPEQTILDLISYQPLNVNLLVSTETEKEAQVGEYLETLVADRPELSMETLAERRIMYKQNAEQLFGAISGLAVFIMMFSILSMMNTLITNIVTRKQELAMLESIGMAQRQLARMLLGESFLLAFVTVGVTMTVGTICGYMLSRFLYENGAIYMVFRFPGAFAAAYVAVLLLVPLAITLFSMHSFSKEALVERIRGVEN